MATTLVNKKYLYFRHLGADLTLNLTNAPWLSNVLKITGLTTATSAGLNARSNYTGAFNGSTPGGTLQKLVQNGDYEMVCGSYGGWGLPNSLLIASLDNDTALVLFFAPTGSAFTFPPITILASEAGNYSLPTTATNLSGLSYTKNGSSVVGLVALAENDTLVVTGAAASGSAPVALTLTRQQ